VSVKRGSVNKRRSASGASGMIIPGFLRQLYSVPETTFSSQSSFALAEFLDYSSYDKNELAKMLKVWFECFVFCSFKEGYSVILFSFALLKE
jgi:hypothetical protein